MNQDRKLDLVAPVSAVDHILGASHAPVTIVEYGDFECPNCKQAAPGVKLLLERYAGRIRFAYRHFPLEEVHPHALVAAEAAEAAGSQGKFWQMHDLLFDNQAHLKPKQLHGYAERLELDMARYAVELDEHVHLQRIREHIESGRRSGVRGTPGFFLNGTIRDVSFGLQSLLDGIDAVLKRR
jgi:protein-disulfide isomerase